MATKNAKVYLCECWPGIVDYVLWATVSSDHNCPRAPPIKLKDHRVIWPHGPRLDVRKQLCRRRAPTSLCHAAVMQLWHFDESPASPYWYCVCDAIPSPAALRWHFLPKLSKALSRSGQKLCARQQLLTGGSWGWEWRSSLQWWMWHHSVMMVICWRAPFQKLLNLDVQGGDAWQGAVCLLARRDVKAGIERWPHLSVKSP